MAKKVWLQGLLFHHALVLDNAFVFCRRWLDYERELEAREMDARARGFQRLRQIEMDMEERERERRLRNRELLERRLAEQEMDFRYQWLGEHWFELQQNN